MLRLVSAIRPRPRPPIPSGGGDPGTGGGISKPPRRHSDETRQRLAEVAVERHRNGGFKPVPGRPKRKPSRRRIAELVAIAALEEKTAQDIIDVFKDGIAPHQPIQIRLKAAEAWIRVDQEEAKHQLKQERNEGEAMDREAALAFLADRLSTGHAASLIRKQLESENIADADVVEDEADDDIVDDD